MASSTSTVSCPICSKAVKSNDINRHLDSNCEELVEQPTPPPTQANAERRSKTASFFHTPAAKSAAAVRNGEVGTPSTQHERASAQASAATPAATSPRTLNGVKRAADDDETTATQGEGRTAQPTSGKRAKNSHAPLAERMRPQNLDEVAGQELVGPDGVLRNLIVTDRVPSMILWGGPGTGKTTIARLIAHSAGARFVEINSTSSGVGECKRLFEEARNEVRLTGRKTIIFCDEIHRFSKSQQDVFLGPVEAGQVTLIGATTENPSFKVVNALLSRCRTFTLSKLSEQDVFDILKRALAHEVPDLPTPSPSPSMSNDVHSALPSSSEPGPRLLTADDFALLHYLSSFADGDARTGLNLLELALDLCRRPGTTPDSIKRSLTQTLVYDRAGDQHYDTISAFHKSVRGSSPDAALYYLARMLQSGEDPLYVARRMVVMASEDIGLADNAMLPLATAAYAAAERLGMPECRINLAHCAVALALAPKSVRAYRGLNAAYAALAEPGVAGLPVPVHLRNAPTRLMKELGYGKEYKYNPDFVQGRVVQEYLPEKLAGRVFLRGRDLGDEVDREVVEAEAEAQTKMAEEVEQRHEEVLLGPDGD